MSSPPDKKIRFGRALLELVIFFFVLLLIDNILGSLVESRRSHATKSFFESKHLISGNSNYEGIVFGDSFSHYAIDPSAVFRNSGSLVFNFAIWAMKSGDLPFVVEEGLERIKPRSYAIIGIDLSLLNSADSAGIFTLGVLSSEVRRIKAIISNLDRDSILKLSRIGRSRELVATAISEIIRGRLGASQSNSEPNSYSRAVRIEHGFVQLEMDKIPFQPNSKWLQSAPSGGSMAIVGREIRRLQRSGLRVVLACLPISNEIADAEDVFIRTSQLITQLREENSTEVFGCFDKNFMLSFDAKLFLDSMHLNATGAALYSEHLGIWIKERKGFLAN